MSYNIFFTSDEHYGHSNVIHFCHRPFSSVEEMTETLVGNNNAIVKDGDAVYHCGDMFWRTVSIPAANVIMDRLKGRHYLILGNHDEVAKRIAGRFEWVKDVHLLDTPVRVWLSHYAHKSWPDSHKSSYHVYGHTHGVMPDYRYSTDVGVDAKNYRPFSYEQLVAHMVAKGKLPMDEVQRDMLQTPKLEEPKWFIPVRIAQSQKASGYPMDTRLLG